ncbi:loganic acid O-methyltransferase-like [Aristolochia californica]|uniref:loganic acid O-methyltransferase-like n=1 Tax=Aristolochia californica TaxID=171875 RepID=UPI0035DF52E8
MESQPMNGGEGPNSYAQNSSYQRAGVSAATVFLQDGIAKEFEIGQYPCARNSIVIADLGCSIGPNTFLAVQAIIEAVKLKYKSSIGLFFDDMPEFLVFFNDQVANDFNTLFRSLPSEGRYFAAGMPGSFYHRLFPKASLHFVHSSYANQWLSQVPKEVRDENSLAWNKGRIFYTGAPTEVGTAYAAQYAKDLESFLQARAQEVVVGGLMALLFPCCQNGNSSNESPLAKVFSLLGSTLMDMAKTGDIEKGKVDSFNLPIYIPSITEFKTLVRSNGYFSVVRMETLPPISMPANDGIARAVSMSTRAAMEGIISHHFGCQVIDDLFERYQKKIVSHLQNPHGVGAELFVLLKRKPLSIN